MHTPYGPRLWLPSLLGDLTRRLYAVQELSAPTAVVKRDGEWKTVEVRELVPGDVIELKGGDVIPADAVVSPSPWP